MFPDLPNPFRQSIIPNLGSTPAGQLPPMVTGANPSVINANQRFGSLPINQRIERIEQVDKLLD